MTPDRFEARNALSRFKNALDSLEQEFKPLAPEMSLECQFELECLGKIARSFFRMANEEVFSASHSKRKEAVIRE